MENTAASRDVPPDGDALVGTDLLIDESMRSHARNEQEFVAMVEAGIADFAAGRTVDLDTAAAAIRASIRPIP